MRVLSLDAGRVVTFETLLRRVWGKPESAGANLVRNLVRNLRRKRLQPRLPAQRARRRLPHGRSRRAREARRHRTAGPSGPRSPRRRATRTTALRHTRVVPSPTPAPSRRPRPRPCGAAPDPPGLDTEAARETTRSPVTTCPGGRYDPGGLPRDRNTPRIEIRRISDLETLGNHEP